MDSISIKALTELNADIAVQEEVLLANKVKRQELLDACDPRREDGGGAVSIELPHGYAMFTCDLCGASWSAE